MYGMDVVVQHAAAVKFPEEGWDATGAVHVLHVVVVVVRRHLRQGWDLGTDAADVSEVEVDPALARHRQDVKHGVGGATHRHVKGHRVLESLLCGDVAGQNGVIVLVVVALAQVDDDLPGLFKQGFACNVGGKSRTVTG